jgi:hypothetical protein
MTYDGVSSNEFVNLMAKWDVYDIHPSPDKALVGWRWVGRPERMFTNSPIPFTLAA